jgi:hypothetical protein
MICGRPVVQIGRPQPVVISADLMKHLWGRKNSLAGVEHACCCRDRSAAHFQLSSTSGTHQSLHACSVFTRHPMSKKAVDRSFILNLTPALERDTVAQK